MKGKRKNGNHALTVGKHSIRGLREGKEDAPQMTEREKEGRLGFGASKKAIAVNRAARSLQYVINSSGEASTLQRRWPRSLKPASDSDCVEGPREKKKREGKGEGGRGTSVAPNAGGPNCRPERGGKKRKKRGRKKGPSSPCKRAANMFPKKGASSTSDPALPSIPSPGWGGKGGEGKKRGSAQGDRKRGS